MSNRWQVYAADMSGMHPAGMGLFESYVCGAWEMVAVFGTREEAADYVRLRVVGHVCGATAYHVQEEEKG